MLSARITYVAVALEGHELGAGAAYMECELARLPAIASLLRSGVVLVDGESAGLDVQPRPRS